jgi:hypothetical protein
MKKLTFLAASLLLLMGVAPARASHPGSATPADLQRLQVDLDNLDDVLATLPADDPRATDFRRRADDIRDDVTWLRVQVRRHQRSSSQGLGATAEEVDQIRSDINELRKDIEVAYGYRYSGGEARLAQGTDIQARLEQSLSSKTARPEQRVEATVVRPVRLDDRIVIPAGALVSGVVRSVQPAQRPARGGRLELAFNRIQADGRTWVDMQTRIVSMKENLDRSDTAKKAGIGAALGGLLGQVIGGTKGAILGVLIGGAGGAIASEGDDVELPEGTILTLRLDQPLSVVSR